MDEVGGFIDPLLNERLLGILSTKENVNLETLGFVNDIKKYTANHNTDRHCRRAARNTVCVPGE